VRRSASVPLHQPLRRRAEVEALVQPLRVPRVKQPTGVGERAAFDRLANELHPEAIAAVFLEHVDVSEIRERVPVRERSCEADLPVSVIETDDARGSANEVFDDGSRASLRPVRLLGEVPMDGVEVDACWIVVELVAIRQLSPHRAPR
jgi:hypothetical protein